MSVTQLPSDLEELIRESDREGFAFVKRLASEWVSNINRFDNIGEFLLVSSSFNRTTGICGINTDPYLLDPEVARLRHLYVLPAFRSQAIGSKLVCECLARAKPKYKCVRLRVPDDGTGLFYENMGFKAIEDATATHSFVF